MTRPAQGCHGERADHQRRGSRPRSARHVSCTKPAGGMGGREHRGHVGRSDDKRNAGGRKTPAAVRARNQHSGTKYQPQHGSMMNSASPRTLAGERHQQGRVVVEIVEKHCDGHQRRTA